MFTARLLKMDDREKGSFASRISGCSGKGMSSVAGIATAVASASSGIGGSLSTTEVMDLSRRRYASSSGKDAAGAREGVVRFKPGNGVRETSGSAICADALGTATGPCVAS
jgi:hypothetical protein